MMTLPERELLCTSTTNTMSLLNALTNFGGVLNLLALKQDEEVANDVNPSYVP
jgi:hypothetical protein